MLKNLKLRPVHGFLMALVLAITIMIWKGCQKEPKPVINVPTVSPPASVTSAPTDAEAEALKRLQHHEQHRQRHD